LVPHDVVLAGELLAIENAMDITFYNCFAMFSMAESNRLRLTDEISQSVVKTRESLAVQANKLLAEERDLLKILDESPK